MRHSIMFALSLTLLISFCFAQPTIVWQKSLGGSDYDYAYSIQQTTDGGFIVAGLSWSNDGDVSGNHGNEDYWVVKLNSAGEIVWQKSLGGSDYDEAFSIQQTFDGGFIVAGESQSNDGDVSGNHGNEDYWVVKLNSAGEIEWQKCLGGSGIDIAHSIQQTSDGGFIVAGYSYSNDGDVSGNHGCEDYWVVKLNSAGNIEWQKCLGGSDHDFVSSIQQTSDGGFIVAGYTWSNDGDVSGNHGYTDYWVVKLDSAGNIEWQTSLGGSDYDKAYSIQQTSDGGFIVAGESWSNDGDVSGNHGNCDYWVVKLNSAGNIEWQKCLGGSDYDEAYSIQQTYDGSFIVAGCSSSNDGDVSGHHGPTGYPYYDYWVVKLNSAGEIEWQKCFGGSDYDEAWSIQQTTDGGFIVAGESQSNDGDVSGNHGYTDYWVVKLSPEVKITENAIMPEQFEINVFPNPFNSSVAITVSGGRGLASQTLTNIKVYDIMGNVVYAPSIPRSLSPRGERDDATVWDGSESPSPWGEGFRMRGKYIWQPDKSIPSGIYLIKATIGDQTITKRAILMK